VNLSICYGDERIPYTINRVEQRKHKIKINVYPNGRVQVDAPLDSTQQEIQQAIYKRARWIYNHLYQIQGRREFVLPRKYLSGESHFYMGRRYSLKIEVRKKKATGVKLFRGKLVVTTRSKQREIVQALLAEWYREKAGLVFNRRMEELLPSIIWLKNDAPPLQIREMKKQWGSCSPSGKILLNIHLIKAPRECIDYVLLHELCHLKEHNHSPKYYRMLEKLLPNWRNVKAKLDGMSELLLNS